MRGIFFGEDAARAVAAALARAGWEAVVAREQLAGEDDDEDHPWSVLTDAPEPVLDVLVDSHDGWLEQDRDDQAPGPVLPPLRLPAAPRRLTRPALPPGED